MGLVLRPRQGADPAVARLSALSGCDSFPEASTAPVSTRHNLELDHRGRAVWFPCSADVGADRWGVWAGGGGFPGLPASCPLSRCTVREWREVGRGGKQDGVLTPGLLFPGHVSLGYGGRVPGRLQGGGTGWMRLGGLEAGGRDPVCSSRALQGEGGGGVRGESGEAEDVSSESRESRSAGRALRVLSVSQTERARARVPWADAVCVPATLPGLCPSSEGDGAAAWKKPRPTWALWRVGLQGRGRAELPSQTLPAPAGRILPPLPGVDVGLSRWQLHLPTLPGRLARDVQPEGHVPRTAVQAPAPALDTPELPVLGHRPPVSSLQLCLGRLCERLAPPDPDVPGACRGR